ncbi:MAG: hypothetical protein JWN25_1727 [Verrucomicrobiales bacterium]|jgi:hypothetical protein|nr:hypothetical protein [Verrucomicrobiales bacterium]
MTVLAQINSGAIEPEKLIAVLATVGLLGFAAWRIVKWLIQVQPAPDPWDAQTAADIAKDDAVPLCYHCLCPHSEATHFCSECGTTVGQYTNWLPFPQLFSIGHLFRIGTSGNYKYSVLTILGFWYFALAKYTIFAPIYWVMFLRNIHLRNRSTLLPVRAPEETPQSS